jgi:hypothetical protein
MTWCEINRTLDKLGKTENLPPRPLTLSPSDQITIKYRLHQGSEIESWFVFLREDGKLMLGHAFDDRIDTITPFPSEDVEKKRWLKSKVEWVKGCSFTVNPVLVVSETA